MRDQTVTPTLNCSTGRIPGGNRRMSLAQWQSGSTAGLSLEQMRRKLGVTAWCHSGKGGHGPSCGEEGSLSKSISWVLRKGRDLSREQSSPRSWEWLVQSITAARLPDLALGAGTGVKAHLLLPDILLVLWPGKLN